MNILINVQFLADGLKLLSVKVFWTAENNFGLYFNFGAMVFQLLARKTSHLPG